MTGITIAFIIVAVFFILWLVKGVLNGTGSKNKYTMPDLVGSDYYEAKDTYGFLDLQIEETEYTSFEKDVIYFQDIQVGENVANGQVVKVNVSLGINMTVVPDVHGYNHEYARKVLEQEGFVVEEKYEMSSDGTKENDVIRTEPAAGEELEAGKPVVVFVSRGMNNDSIEIPSMIGQTLEQATTLCEYYGLIVETLDEASLEEEGTIIGQEPEAGEFVETGSTVKLIYSNGEDPSGRVTYTLPIPSFVTTGRFTIDIIDASGTSRSSKTIVAGIANSATIDIEGTGTETLTVVLTGSDGKSSTVGTYKFNFAEQNFTKVNEDINAAFEAVGATEPTDPPTDPPTEYVEPVTDAPQTEYVAPVETDAPQTEYVEPMTNPDLPASSSSSE